MITRAICRPLVRPLLGKLRGRAGSARQQLPLLIINEVALPIPQPFILNEFALPLRAAA